ncbi:uncharacterized protein LOC111624615 [Centruroides sculpturatus]|uniref:uncharacterized protein LOC111624615 n=1 Tax=Centruroides sculpturatus TaxID=218467 RepID=UPI000C6EA68C|nr:uncharacterized protein LOC111624615 [Centruroides sculpturatus]XP_023223284.1 uncharacterized protein LOC111624615 [Centruroides sculpturatus]XP_023223285.1 uncharacterized protein LOC111624615 [Centruroides sculpturatus]
MDKKRFIRWSISILGCVGVVVTILCVCTIVIPVPNGTFNSGKVNGFSADLGVAAGVSLTVLGIASFFFSTEEKLPLACVCFYLIPTAALSLAALVIAVRHILHFNREDPTSILHRLGAVAAVNAISFLVQVTTITAGIMDLVE